MISNSPRFGRNFRQAEFGKTVVRAVRAFRVLVVEARSARNDFSTFKFSDKNLYAYITSLVKDMRPALHSMAALAMISRKLFQICMPGTRMGNGRRCETTKLMASTLISRILFKRQTKGAIGKAGTNKVTKANCTIISMYSSATPENM